VVSLMLLPTFWMIIVPWSSGSSWTSDLGDVDTKILGNIRNILELYKWPQVGFSLSVCMKNTHSGVCPCICTSCTFMHSVMCYLTNLSVAMDLWHSWYINEKVRGVAGMIPTVGKGNSQTNTYSKAALSTISSAWTGLTSKLFPVVMFTCCANYTANSLSFWGPT
jgi:hypothetical protein